MNLRFPILSLLFTAFCMTAVAQDNVIRARHPQNGMREARKTRLNTTTYSLDFDKNNFSTLRQTVQMADGSCVDVIYKAYLHIPYVAHPLDTDYQSLSIFEPIFIDGKAVDASSAPILFSNRVGGYMPVDDSSTEDVGGRGGNLRESLALASGMVVVVPGCRGRVNQTEDGEYIGKAPAALVDLKAAVRYLRHNKGIVPGDTEKMVSMGCSAGGAISAALAASGNSPLFEPYLKKIGAAEERDDFFAGGVFSPIMDIQHGDMAYEWEFGEVPLSKTGELADPAFSAELKVLFAEYEKSLNLQGINGFGHLTADNLGDYIATYWLNPAATHYLEGLSEGERAAYLKDKAWLNWDGSAAHMTMKDYNAHYSGRFKALPAFDKFDLSEAENGLFGDATHDSRHMTEFSIRHTGEGSISADFQKVIDMMNPLYYVVPSLNPGASHHWWIRHGTTESGISRAAVVNFSTALIGHGLDVNSKLYWDAMHCVDKDPHGFISWIGEITDWSVKVPGARDPRVNATPGQFTNRTFKDGDSSLPYNLYVPSGYDRSKKYPLVVFVHDAGRISNDPTASTQLEGAKAWSTPESQAKNPCFVLAPQYGSNTLTGKTGSVSQQDITLHLIQSVCREFSVDTDRIYGTGQSMGCMQTMEMAMEHPDLFAACLLVSGQLDPEKCDALANYDLWIVVSEDDERAFPGMNALTEYLKTKGAKVSYSSVPAQLSQEAYHHLADSLIATGSNIQFVSLAAGTLPKEELKKFAMGGGQRRTGDGPGPSRQMRQGGPEGQGGPGQNGNRGSADAASTKPITPEGAMAHMASFDVIYRIDAFREWLFTKKKK